jgi:hypothetical protein
MPFGLSAGISAGGSLLTGIMGKGAANHAADLQAKSAQRVAGMAQTAGTNAQNLVGQAAPQAISQVQGLLSPYTQLGTESAGLLGKAIAPGGSLTTPFSFNPTDLQNDPGYQFRLQQGDQAIQNSASARGTLLSGGTLKDLMSYNQGLAGTEYQNAYNRALGTYQTNFGNTLNSLFGTSQLAASPTAQAANFTGNTLTNTAQYQGNAGLQAAQIAGTALTGGANAQAGGIVGGTNALNQGIAGAGNALTNYSIYSNLFGQGGGVGGSGWLPGPGGMPGMNGPALQQQGNPLMNPGSYTGL